MEVEVEAETVFRTGLPRAVLEASAFGTVFGAGWGCYYDTAPSGRLVIVVGAEQGISTMVLAEGLL
jgi:hypothetical protein